MIKQLLLKNSLCRIVRFALIILIVILVVSKKSSFAQHQNLNFNTSLDSVLSYFSQEFGYKFAYDNELVQKIIINQKINFSDSEKELEKLLISNGFTFKLINSVYIIIPVNKDKPKEKYNLVGIIKDKETGESLPFAHIITIDKELFCVSNQDGYFSFLDLSLDTLSLIISYVGYNPAVYKIKSFKEKELKVFYLSSQNLEINEVVIRAESENTLQADNQTGLTTLNTLDIYKLPNSGESDVFKLVQMMPGIKSTNESSADLIIRGGSMDQNLILFDDFTLYHVDHFYGMVSSLNPKVIKHVQVYKGGFDARYGGRMNSVVNIVGKSGNSVKPSIDFGVNMLSANLMIEAPLFNKGSVLIAGRRSYTDIIQTPLFNQMFENINDYDEINILPTDSFNISNGMSSGMSGTDEYKPVFYFYDINAKLSYSITEKDNIALSYFSSFDKLERDESIYGSFFRNDDVLGNNGLSLRWGKQWNNRFYTKFLLSQSKFFNEFLSTEQYELDFENYITFKIQNTNDIDEKALKFNSEYKYSDNLSLDFGYELVNQRINYILKYSYDDIEEIGEDISNNSYLHSAFLQGRLENFYKFDLSLGLRSSYYKQTDKLYLEPRFNLTYHWNNYFRLKAAIGKYNQFLTKVFTGEEITNSKSLWFISDNKDIPVGKSNQYIVGFQYSKNKFLIDIEYYKKKVDGIVKYVYDFSSYYELTYDTSFYETGASFHSGSSDIQGVDVLISKDFGKFYSWISYSLSENNNKFDKLNNGKQFPSVNDQRHEFKIAGIKSFKNWTVALTWIYGTGFVYSYPYYSIDNYYYEDIKLPDYHKLDCSFTYNFKLQNFKGNIGISVLNVYNRQNKKIQELIPYVDESDTYYDLMSVNLPGRAISAFFNIKF